MDSRACDRGHAEMKLLSQQYQKSVKYRNMQFPDEVWYKRKRYLVTSMTLMGIFFMYIIRTNLSVAMVKMFSVESVTIGNLTFQKAEFNWTSAEKGFTISLFFYGYLMAPVGGVLGHKFGAVTVFGLGTALAALLSCTSPYFLCHNFYIYSIVRILEGVFEGFSFANYPLIFLSWFPPNEYCTSIITAYIGCALGPAANYVISGYIADTMGWKSIFYAEGGLTLIWYLLWLVLVANEPSSDRFISNKEKNYLIQKTSGLIDREINYPWKTILTSKPFWVYVNENFTTAWVYSFTVLSLPIYIKDVNDMKVRDIGLISSIPPLCAFVTQPIAAIMADWIRTKKILSISSAHKLFITTGQMTTAFLLIVTGMWANFEESIVTFSVIRIGLGLAEISYQALAIDMFSQYAGIAKGAGTAAIALSSLLSPTLMGIMTENHTRAEWNNFFLVSSAMNIWSLIIYLKYGSGKLQSWAVAASATKSTHQNSETNENNTAIEKNI